MSAPTIEQELALVAQKVPDFAPRVRDAIEAGEIGGSTYHICFYGKIYPDDIWKAIKLAEQVCAELGCSMTPIEKLLLGCFGFTHKDHPRLATLHTALQAYLPPKEQGV